MQKQWRRAIWAQTVSGLLNLLLDFHYNFSDRDVQYKNFPAHIEASRETGLPLIIHSRNADDEMAEILEREMGRGAFPALLHCYTSGENLAMRAVDLGIYFSMSGIITFKNANDIRELAKNLPGDKLFATGCTDLFGDFVPRNSVDAGGAGDSTSPIFSLMPVFILTVMIAVLHELF